MQHIYVDFNSTVQDLEHNGTHVILGRDDEMVSGELPVLHPDERVTTYDEEMEVEGTAVHQADFWFAALDWDMLKRNA